MAHTALIVILRLLHVNVSLNSASPFDAFMTVFIPTCELLHVHNRGFYDYQHV